MKTKTKKEIFDRWKKIINLDDIKWEKPEPRILTLTQEYIKATDCPIKDAAELWRSPISLLYGCEPIPYKDIIEDYINWIKDKQ